MMEQYYQCNKLTVSVLDKQGHLLHVLRWQHLRHGVSIQQHSETSRHSAKFTNSNPEKSQCSKLHHRECADSQPELITNEGKKYKMSVCSCIDPLLSSCITCELQRSMTFRDAFVTLLMKHCKQHHGMCPSKDFSKSESKCRGRWTKQVHLKVTMRLTDFKFFRMDPDIQWSERMLPQWTIRLVLEDAFSWLSTLGGAYSSLGERFTHCAIEAGHLSLRQLRLAIRLGDPLLQARCHVYMALSLMQRGFLRQAKQVILNQYRFALSLGEHTDMRLIAMCQGVWCHLRFHYIKRRQRREAGRCKTGMGKYGTLHNGTKEVDTNHAMQNALVISNSML